MNKSASYLSLSRHNIFYFRAVVPSRYPDSISGIEYRRSLNTRDIQKARAMVRILRSSYEHGLAQITEGLMDWDDLKLFLDDTLTDILTQESKRISLQGPRTEATLRLWEDHQITNYSRDAQALSQFNSSPDQYPYAKSLANNLLQQLPEPPEEDSGLYRQFCEAVLRMQVEAFNEMIKLNEEAKSFRTSSTSHTPSAYDTDLALDMTSRTTAPKLSIALDDFIKERKHGDDNWSPLSEEAYMQSVGLLIEMSGDVPISSIASPQASHFKKVLMSIPANRKKQKIYAGMKIRDFLTTPAPSDLKLHPTTINNKLTQLSSLFNWAKQNGLVSSNPFTGLKIKTKKQRKEAFTTKEVTTLFNTSQYTGKKPLHSYYYWLPLIGLYTGARIEEICQLALDDIKQVDGTWVFDINKSGNKKVKTESSIRLVPIHSSILKAGLITYTLKLRDQKHTRLFPELAKRPKGYSVDASKWFGRFRKKHGISQTFHRFRDTLINDLKQQGVPKEEITAIVGHKEESMTFGSYSEQYSPAYLSKVLGKLSFDVHIEPYKWAPSCTTKANIEKT